MENFSMRNQRISCTAVLRYGYCSSSSVPNADMEDLSLLKCHHSCNDIKHYKSGHKVEPIESVSLFAQCKHLIRWYGKTELMAFASSVKIKFCMLQKICF